MSRSWIIAAGTMALVPAGSSVVCAAERTEDPHGDVIGDAPDLVSVTFSQPEDELRVVAIDAVTCAHPLTSTTQQCC